jgi:hypothetical protein
MTFISNYPPVTESNIEGKPYIIVSPKGIANGLSDIPNDGADFGPDTMLNATDPSQIGAPYTQTSGIQEAINYMLAHYQTGSISITVPTIKLSNGQFIVQSGIKINIPNSNPPNGFAIYGENQLTTYIYVETNDDLFLINNPNSTNIQVTLADMAPIPISPYTPNSLLNWKDPQLINQTLVIQHTNGSAGGWVNGTLYLNNLANVILFDHERYGTGVNISNVSFYTDIGGTNDLSVLGQTNNGAGINSNLINVNEVLIDGAWIGWYNLSGCGAVKIRGNEFQGLVLSGNNGTIDIDASGNFILTGPYSSTSFTPTVIYNNSGTSITVDNFRMKLYYWWRQSPIYFWNGNISFNNIDIELHAIMNSTVPNFAIPTQSSTAGTTAGTVNIISTQYTKNYKKYIIQFSGYENNTTTNQTINYPLPFSTSAVITGNNTGLTITASTTGITITSPNSTTTYSGIAIVEGY